MTHKQADYLERIHHFLYRRIRGRVSENQYVGTVKMGEEELERALFHSHDVSYNWLAYWKKHPDGRNSTGSYKLRYPAHARYTAAGMQVHITIFRSTENDGWVDVYAHYEYDNERHPIRHVLEQRFSAEEGVNRARQFFRDNHVDIYHLRGGENE